MVWQFPAEVKGWLTLAEGQKLADLARGKRTLEIGSYCGRSSICIGQAAASLDCIDPMDGRTIPEHGGGSTVAEFKRNLIQYKVGARLYVGTTAEVVADLDPGYDLIFVDGAHNVEAVRVDIEAARRLLVPGGLLAFHDYGREPGVAEAIGEAINRGAELLERVDSIAVVRLKPAPQDKPTVLLAMPRRGNQAGFRACRAYFGEPTFGDCNVVLADIAGSILDSNFNKMWCGALNLRAEGVTHFAMIHDDQAPEGGWLDILLRELRKAKADVISAIIPIKDRRGLTSTATETADVWKPKRLTMREAMELPTTITDADVGGPLLLNTGLWLADLRGAWVDTPEPPYFQTLSRLVQGDDGKWRAQVRSEDWEFSRELRRRGVRLAATRAVSLLHEGESVYPNDRAWGTWETDEVHTPRTEGVETPEGELCPIPT